MYTETTLTQEPQSERVTVMLTAEEKEAVEFLRSVLDTTKSDLLRENRPQELVQRAREIRRRVQESAA